jgi:hypothetical protein
MGWSPSPGVYLAECIDLNIVVRGSSPRDSMEKIKDAIIGYLQVVSEGDEKGLLPRPSPFSHRLRYRWYSLMAALTSRHRNYQVCDQSFDCPAFC